MKLQTLPAVVVTEGFVLPDATLEPFEVAQMNFAREEFNKLVTILWPLLDPLLCDDKNVVAADIARHLEQVRSFSGNFCWRHRHVGHMYSAQSVGGAL